MQTKIQADFFSLLKNLKLQLKGTKGDKRQKILNNIQIAESINEQYAALKSIKQSINNKLTSNNIIIPYITNNINNILSIVKESIRSNNFNNSTVSQINKINLNINDEINTINATKSGITYDFTSCLEQESVIYNYKLY